MTKKKFTLRITELDGEAFKNDPHAEIGRILSALALRIKYDNQFLGPLHQNLCDSNGNVVGTYVLKDE